MVTIFASLDMNDVTYLTTTAMYIGLLLWLLMMYNRHLDNKMRQMREEMHDFATQVRNEVSRIRDHHLDSILHTHQQGTTEEWYDAVAEPRDKDTLS